MPVSGPIVGSVKRGSPKIRVLVGMHQERGAPLEVGAQQVDALLGLRPVLDDHVLEFVVQKLLGRLLVGRIHLDEIGQHAERLQPAGLALLDRREQPLDGLGGVGAVREDLLERVLAGLDAREIRAQGVQALARFASTSSAGRPAPPPPAASARRPIPVPVCRSRIRLEASSFDAASHSRSASAVCSSFWILAVSRSTPARYSFDLRQLVLQRGRLAQQPEHDLAAALDVPARAPARPAEAVPARRSSRRGARGPTRLRPPAPAPARCAPPARARIPSARLPRSSDSFSPCVSRCSMEAICWAWLSSRPRVRSASSFRSASRRRASVSSRSLR